jgi:hypothetical protein
VDLAIFVVSAFSAFCSSSMALQVGIVGFAVSIAHKSSPARNTMSIFAFAPETHFNDTLASEF